MLDRNFSGKRTRLPRAIFLPGFIVAAALLPLIAWPQSGSPTTGTNPDGESARGGVAAPSTDAGSEAGSAAEEMAKLGVKPRSNSTILEKSESVVDALRRSDFQSAAAITKEVLGRSALQQFSFAPFNRFMGALTPENDLKYLDGLNAWVIHDRKSSLPYLLRASYLFNTAWLVRGSNFSQAVPPEHLKAFHDYLNRADDDIARSIAIDSKIPWSYYLRLQISASRDDSERLEKDFSNAIAHFPTYYELYRIKLHYLQPKWGGSVEKMYEFVDRYAGKAPPSSSLRLLYLQLTANLLNTAWIACDNLKYEQLTACMDSQMNRLVTTGLTEGVTTALKLYKYSDAVQYSKALWPILRGMASTPGHSTSLNSLVQLAADAMGSDNQLIHESRNNNFVLDDITAWIWLDMDNPVNTDQKFREALDDVMRMGFANDEERDLELAEIYDDMASLASRQSQYANLIVFHDTAAALAGDNHGGAPYRKCFAYYKLRQFRQAIEECTKLIDAHRDVMNGYYYRARAYEGLRNYEASSADFAQVAEAGSDNGTRVASVIEMDHVNALMGRYSTELEIFDKYPFVFNEAIQMPDDLAIVYNNRCFAYMKLGRLEQALADCNTSLKFGRLPDALHKQRELTKMLGRESS